MEQTNTTNEQQSVNEQKLASAKQEIEEILQKYEVALVPIVVHQGDRTFSRIDIAPVQPQQSEQQ